MKLYCSLEDVREYVVSLPLLMWYCREGMRVAKVHRIWFVAQAPYPPRAPDATRRHAGEGNDGVAEGRLQDRQRLPVRLHAREQRGPP